MELNFELDHNEEIDLKNNLMQWWLVWKQNLVFQVLVLIFGLSGIIIECLNTTPRTAFDSIVIGCTFYFALTTGYFFSLAIKTRKRIINRVKARSKILQNKKINIKFNEEGLEYKDEEFRTQMRWPLFHHFNIHKKTILLKTQHSEYASFIISESEIGPEKFSELITFLKTKMYLL